MTTPAPEPESAAPLDPASYLGPSNPISNDAPSRSQSPAKRLKSEEPPNTTVETSLDETPATPEPMDEDAKSRESSVEMVDAVATQPDTAEAVDSSAGSSIAATATQPSTAPTSTATSIVPAPPPSVEEQIRMYKAANKLSLEEGGIYYIISRTWVNQFIAQSHEAAMAAGIDLKQISGEELGPIDNTSITDAEDGMPTLADFNRIGMLTVMLQDSCLLRTRCSMVDSRP
jgi:ubiquitin carboxyl-terminal hydrolase 4/11/15